MFKKILIANRGEIACRIIRTARDMGIATVAVYSDADKYAAHVKMADEAFYLGASPATESYLRIDKIMAVVERCGAEAIHPGYGFLSENAAFCAACNAADVVFIGPPVSAIEAMGSKSAAKRIMSEANVPLVPGYHENNQDTGVLKQASDEIGYPVLLKAVAGGGGKGMRVVECAEDFESALLSAKREAAASFANDDMLVEKYLGNPRHIEVQVFCDTHGGGVYLGDRDCSIQRRHQKIIEEAPAPGLSDALRKNMGEAALKAARAIDYVGAGTVEFLLDGDDLLQQDFYFMEMNTRLQVEHPVTEMVTGQDLVEWQLRVAAGQALPLSQSSIVVSGHSMEARIYAEDPNENFRPSTGTLRYLALPSLNPHVRVDSGVVEGDEVSVFYDPMIAKLVVWGNSREQAREALLRALGQYHVVGVENNIDFLSAISRHEKFANAQFSTKFLEIHHDIFSPTIKPQQQELLLLAAAVLARRSEKDTSVSGGQTDTHASPWSALAGWRMNLASPYQCVFIVNDIAYEIIISGKNNRTSTSESLVATLFLHGEDPSQAIFSSEILLLENDSLSVSVQINDRTERISVVAHENDGVYSAFSSQARVTFSLPLIDRGEGALSEISTQVIAPMNGRVVDVLISAGQKINKGEALIVTEAMKMEHTIVAAFDGDVESVMCKPDDLVKGGQVLAQLSCDEEET